MPSEYDYTEAIAHHEAGHGVVWETLTGRKPFQYLWEPYFVFNAGAAVDVLRGRRARFWPRYLKPACIMGASGAAAQAKFQRKRFQSVWESDCCITDRHMFEALRRKCGADADELFSEAQRLVREHWSAIQDVAEKLMECGGRMGCE